MPCRRRLTSCPGSGVARRWRFLGEGGGSETTRQIILHFAGFFCFSMDGCIFSENSVVVPNSRVVPGVQFVCVQLVRGGGGGGGGGETTPEAPVFHPIRCSMDGCVLHDSCFVPDSRVTGASVSSVEVCGDMGVRACRKIESRSIRFLPTGICLFFEVPLIVDWAQ